jgi:hypothetical protein
MSAASKASHLRESPYDEALAGISEGKWNRYQKAFVPVENRLIERVNQMGDPRQIELAGGLAASGVAQKFDPAIRSAERGMILNGVTPNSGSFIAKEAEARATGGSAIASAGIGGKMGQQTRHLQGLQNVMAIGNAQSVDAQGSMSELASRESSRANADLELDSTNKAAMGGAIGTAAGIGIRGALKYWGG